jgi:Mrp family chromosome partitioning ATPase
VNVVTDALVVSRFAAGIVLSVRHRKSSHVELRRTISSIEFSNLPILGIILSESADMVPGYGRKRSYNRYGYRKSYSGYDNYKYSEDTKPAIL